MRIVAEPSRKHWAALMLAVYALIIALAAPLAAQTFRGTILGTVSDPNGAVVPDANVTAKNVATGIERSTVTDEFGNYSLSELQIGTYQVVVSKTGFETLTINGVTVEVAAERRVDANLAVAGTTDQVIIAANNQVETTNNTLGGTISTKEVEDLPVNGRDFTKFLVMVPGATGDPSGLNAVRLSVEVKKCQGYLKPGTATVSRWPFSLAW